MLYPHLNGRRVILASQSPRRLELVRGLELNPITWLKEVDESFPSDISGPQIALHVAQLKAQAYWDELEDNDVLITGDTVVLLGNEVLQKPASRSEAEAMLEALSNTTHTVASGIAVTTKSHRHSSSRRHMRSHLQSTHRGIHRALFGSLSTLR